MLRNENSEISNKNAKLNKYESTLSRKPPWPGSVSEESFIPIERLILDINKSPTTPNNININEITIVTNMLVPRFIEILILINIVPNIKPNIKPSTVLFGEIVSMSFLFPILLPASYAAISDIAIDKIAR